VTIITHVFCLYTSGHIPPPPARKTE